ncbi:autotransporter assembly complex protein TamA [Novosphingobium album (ex Hu et al. 2023)]|uniref:BamA/TamA family outer membrane protein n=1 Tax=Novosphingobium album (ex Hu et al. 2023) TaxID=2930093 RepID=A0ABT0AX98_9SPHN|nr:BamA/TamA family outer membrane protein [Novosphingobium album (ex Hu et al. 2023)]MCJ2177430.1 BamA/TamA family outer membrane protein [Novosphingobium album (ex Hu et al. 2023)]
MSRLVDRPAFCGLRYRREAGLLALSAVLASSASPVLAQGTPSAPGVDAENANASEEQLSAGHVAVPAPPADATLPEVEPVISDKEFNASVPTLDAQDDPELDKPLESLESFERRLAAEQSGATPEEGQSPPLGDASLADGDAAEEIGDAPVTDTELAAPLPSLDTFEVTPVQFAEDESTDEKEVEVAYSVDLEGLEEADKQTDVSLKGEFNSFSALKQGDGKAANTAMVRARLNEDSQLLQTILASEGWYSPVVRSRLTPSRDKDRKGLVALLSVKPGKRYVFSDIVIEAAPTEPPDLIRNNLALKTGGPIIADRVQGAEAQVAVALPENGYPFAEVGERDILLDRDTGEGVYKLPVAVGPRGRFDSFTTDGSLAFSADHIHVLSRFKQGELYDSRKVDDLRKALIATNLFRAVSVAPQRNGETQGDGTEYVTLHVQQEAGPPRTIAGSVGYAAGEGISAQASWTHRNLFPPEGALIASATAGTQQQGAGVTFRRSNAGKRDRTFEATAEAFHNDYDAYSAYTGRLAARISRDSTPLWQKRYTYAYGVELLATAETDYDAGTGERKRHTYYVAGLNGQLGFDTTDDLLNPAKGFRVTALVQPETTIDGGFNPYVRARFDTSTYYAVSDSLVLAGRIRLGTIQGTGLFDIAPSRRLYAGGGGSVRGYAYQGLGEQAPDGKPVGGRSLNEGSFEARYRFGNYGVVAFVDAGQAYRETMPQFSDMRYGVGLGGRFYTNFGPIRLDVATPINRRSGESLINVYVSIGQAF